MAEIFKKDMLRLWAETGDIVPPADEKISEGWAVEVVPRQWWNWMQNRVDTNVAYMLQKGIPEWDGTTEYIAGKSYVQHNNVIYKSIRTGTNQNPATATTYWQKALVESSASMEAIKAVVPSADTIAYFTGATTAASTSLTSFARTLLDDADAATARNTLGLSNSATIAATNLNTGNTIVQRDASGNFSAGTITASLSGNATTATTATTANALTTARTISLAGDVTGSVSFNGSANVSITATVADDSHNHVISNVDGLQTALDLKVSKDNIVGTVSQSGGIPTGAIIERGSNANGEYVRFADGTQICTHTLEITASVSFQNVFGSTAGTMWRQVQNWTYPATFAANPSVAAGSAGLASPIEFSTNSPSGVFVIPYSSQNGATISVFLTATGRWY